MHWILQEEKGQRHSKYEENKITEEYIDTLKQRLRVYSARIRRYQTSTRRRNDNRVFINNEEIFYRGLKSRKEGEEKEEVPQLEEVKEFWENINRA